MKPLLIISALFFCWQTAMAQPQVPVFEPNAVQIDTTHYKGLMERTSGDDLSLFLYCDRYDSKCDIYHLLSYKDGKWRHYVYCDNFMDDSGNLLTDKYTWTQHKISQRKCNKAWDALLDHNLLKMSAAAQKVMEKKLADGKVDRYSVAHGDNYEFVIRTKDKMRVVYSYSPDKFLEWMPEIKDRQYFVACRDIFLDLVN